MKIGELKYNYPLLYKRILNLIKIGKDNVDGVELSAAFDWEGTTERKEFWRLISNSEFGKAKELQPHLFKDIPIIGNIYVTHNHIHDIVDTAQYNKNNTAVAFNRKVFYNKSFHSIRFNKHPGRLANQEEIDWFTACVKAGKFVEKPTSKKKVEFKVGDTVRCIDKGKKGAGWKKDLVFKITKLTTKNEKDYVAWSSDFPDGVYTSSLELVSENTFEPKVGDYYKAMIDAPNGGAVKQHEIGRIYEISPKYICLCFPYHENYTVKKLSLQNTKLYTKVNPDEIPLEKTIDYEISKECKDSFKCEHGNVFKRCIDEIEKRNQDKITSSNHLTNTSELIQTDILPPSIEDHYTLELKIKDTIRKMFAGDSFKESSDETFMKPVIVKKYKKKSKLLIK